MSVATLHRPAIIVRASGRWALAIMCALALALAGAAAQPRDAWAGGGFVNCGENLSVEYGGDPLQLYIEKINASGTGYMYGWELSDPKPWDSVSESVVTVNLEPGVQSVGASAFYGFTNLETVYIPSTVTRIGNEAFGNCPNLKKVFWDGTDAQWQAFISSGSSVGTGNEALTNNPNLTVCYWGDCSDTSSDNVTWEFDTTTQTFTVRGTGEMKDYGSDDSRDWDGYRDKIKHVEVHDGVTCVGKNAFAHCSELQDIKLYQIEHLSELSYIHSFAFYVCPKLTSVELPSSVTKLGGAAFAYCTGLKSVVIPYKDVEIQESWLTYPFDHCSDDLVITGYALENPAANSLPTYCCEKEILFDAINGDKGTYTADLAGTKSATVADNYLLPSFIQSMLANPKLKMPEGDGTIDLDGNGKVDIAIGYASSGSWILTRADTCNVLPRYTFKLSKQQRLQVARDSGTGFYYGSFSIRLNTVDLSGASVTIPAQTYTGKALKPAVTVKVGGQTLKPGTDYTVAYSNNKNAGTAKAVVKGAGADYTGSITKTFKINKAKASAKAKKSTVKVKYSKVKKKAQCVSNLVVKCDKGKATYKNASSGKAKKFKVNKKTGKVTVPKGTKKGTYKVKVKVTVKTGANYTRLTKTVAFKVKVA